MSLLSYRSNPLGPHLSKRRWPTVLIVLTLTASITLVLFAIRDVSSVNFDLSSLAPLKPQQKNCSLNVNDLQVDGLQSVVHYTRCEMEVVFSSKNEDISDQLNVPLPPSRLVRIKGPSAGEQSDQECPKPIRIQVPKPPPRADASHLVFGVATTLERLNESLDAFSHWAGRTRTRMLAIIEPIPAKDKQEVEQRAVALGLNLYIEESKEEYNDRYFSLIRLLFEKRRNTQWAAIIDDDTFFLSMHNLLARLAALDHTLPYYVGGLSENFRQVKHFGVMAYGGAGIFLSIPLLGQINDVFDVCNKEKVGGDQRIALCIYHHTTTKLTWEHDMSQIDLHGDPAGFYESGRRQPLSVHHWKSWHHTDMAQLSTVAAICGDGCLFKRWRFADDWFLTNGFSMVKYGNPLPAGDLTMEKTWDDWGLVSDDPYLYALAPLRPKDEDKFTYRLEKVIQDPYRVRQFYLHRPESEMADRVLEVVWRRA